MGKYKFLIREILSQSVEVVATSFDDAKEKATEMYEKGEITLDGRNYEGVEIFDTCSECGSTFSEEDSDMLREVNSGLPSSKMICFLCVEDMEDSGKLTRCENCEEVFEPSLLAENPETGFMEICPICGKIWCE